MDDAADVIERAVTREVELHLRRRVPAVGGVHDGAVRVDDHEIVNHHVPVVDRRRGDDEVAVLPPGRDIARGALDKAASQHVLGRRQHSGFGVVHELHRSQHLRVHDVGWHVIRQQRFQPVGDHLCLPQLSVPRGSADMRREHHVGQGGERMADGKPLTLEVVQARRRHLAALERVDQRIGVVQLRAGRIEKHHAVAHRRELLGADHPDGGVGDRRVQGDDVGLLEQFVEAVAGLVVVRVVGDDRDAESSQPPSQRPADGAETHQAGRLSGDLTAAEPLVGDRSVAKHLAGATSASAGSRWRVAANSSATAISATASALRPGVCRTGIPAAVAPAISTLLGRRG